MIKIVQGQEVQGLREVMILKDERGLASIRLKWNRFLQKFPFGLSPLDRPIVQGLDWFSSNYWTKDEDKLGGESDELIDKHSTLKQ